MLPNLTFIFIGRSGSGKGTQIDLVTEKIKALGQSLFLVESGENFRQFVKGPGYANLTAQTIMTEGKLQPAFLATWIWANELITNFKLEKNLIFDGTPRTLGEAKVLDSALGFFKRSKVIVVHLAISREEAAKRLALRGRGDDINEDEVEKRLNWFDGDVVPTIEYYRNHDSHLFFEVNGEQAIEKIASDLNELISPHFLKND